MNISFPMKKLVSIAILLAALLFPATGRCDNPKLAVFPFKNNGQPQQNGLASGLSAMFVTDLARLKNIDVIDPQKVQAALSRRPFYGGAPSVGDALKAAADLGAAYAVTGDFVIFGGRFRIDLRVYDVKSGTVIYTDKAQSKEDAMFDMVDQLSDKMAASLAGAQPPPPGSLHVKTDPPGATLYLDGNSIGTTPAKMKSVKPGTHRIRLELAGYQAYEESIEVKEDELAKVDVKLIRLNGGIRVWWSGVPNSDIVLGGDTIPMNQFQGLYVASRYCGNVPAGDYRVAVRMPFKDETSWDSTPIWRTYSAEVTIGPGEVTDIYVNNDLHSPGIEIGTCGSCAANWDFTTKMSWYEMR